MQGKTILVADDESPQVVALEVLFDTYGAPSTLPRSPTDGPNQGGGDVKPALIRGTGAAPCSDKFLRRLNVGGNTYTSPEIGRLQDHGVSDALCIPRSLAKLARVEVLRDRHVQTRASE